MQLCFSSQQPIPKNPQIIQVIDCLWESDYVDSAYNYLKPLRTPAESGNFWFRVKLIREHRSSKKLPDILGLRNYFGDCSEFLAAHFVKLLDVIPCISEDNAEIMELWFTVAAEVNTTNEVYFHIDNNHTTAGWVDSARCPIWGTVFHLGPRTELLGGATIFCTESPISPAMAQSLHEYLPYDQVRTLSREWIEIPQKQNRLIVFKGSLPHCSTPLRGPSPLLEPRIALLVNIWDHLPIDSSKLVGCSTMQPSEFQVASKLAEGQLDTLADIFQMLTPEEVERLTAYFLRKTSKK